VDVLQVFMDQISARYRPLATNEQAEIVSRAKAGDRVARERMVDSVMPMVVRIAMKVSSGNRRTYLMDLVQEGATGVIRAIEKFDASSGFRWVTYAGNGARLAMLSYLESTRLDDQAVYFKKNCTDRVIEFTDRRPGGPEPDEVPLAIDTCRKARAQMRRRHSRGFEVIRQRLSGHSTVTVSKNLGVSDKRAYVIMHKALSPEISSRIAAVVVCRETAHHAIETLTR
jgi:RNA polymerase sigma factor (sigma-70 family)